MSVLDSPAEKPRASLARPGLGSGERTLIWALVAPLLACIPSLFVGFSNDDLSHRLILEGDAPGYPSKPLGLYDFTPSSFPAPALMDRGYLPWFTDPQL